MKDVGKFLWPSIWSILLPFHIVYGHLVYFVVILVILYQEKSGNAALESENVLKEVSTKETLLSYLQG
jgi:hypothetical protein